MNIFHWKETSSTEPDTFFSQYSNALQYNTKSLFIISLPEGAILAAAMLRFGGRRNNIS